MTSCSPNLDPFGQPAGADLIAPVGGFGTSLDSNALIEIKIKELVCERKSSIIGQLIWRATGQNKT
jgi:hypothetical protein